MNWYDAIFYRKSVRRYLKKPVDPVMLSRIENCAAKLTFIKDTTEVSIKIYERAEAKKIFKGPFMVDAPCYLAVFTKANDRFCMLEAGSFTERLVLYMTTKGLGTCYQGGIKLSPEEVPEGMCCAIVLAFGYAQKDLTRDPKRAKRKDLNKICYFAQLPDDAVRDMLRCARLAPSALNRQPWHFHVWKDHIDLYFVSENPFEKRGNMGSLIDMGIVLSHMIMSAEEQWLHVTVNRDSEKADAVSDHHKLSKEIYVVTLALSDKKE